MNTHSQVLILGIPVDNLTLSTAVSKILSLAEQFKTDGEAKLVATVNVDFLTNALGWHFSKPPRHPELLDILRQADLVTADGMPLVWLSRLLKFPLRERVAGSDLVPALAKMAEQTGHRLFFLGGKGDVAEKAAEKLKKQFPKLNIVDAYAPFVYSEGKEMLCSEADDEQIVERINQSNADILLIGFGNPKQELFFQRNRHKLRVGVVIGVGGTFEFITGRVIRAPIWMQKTGLEWLFRISQDPLRLWKRYMLDGIKLAVMAVPFIIYNFLHQRRDRKQNSQGEISQVVFDGCCVNMPERMNGYNIDSHWMETCLSQIGAMVGNKKTISFNFSKVKFIDSHALGYFVRLLKPLRKEQVKIVITELHDPKIIQLLKVSRVWDIFFPNHVKPSNSYLAEKNNALIANHPESHLMDNTCSLTVQEKTESVTVASLKGRLDANSAYKIDFEEWFSGLGEHDCIIDLSQLQFVDSTGLRIFFRLQRKFASQNGQLILCGANDTLMQLIEITRINDLFHISANIQSAKNHLFQESYDW